MSAPVGLAIAGTIPWAELTAPERSAANAKLDASIEASAKSTSIGRRVAAEGLTKVAIDHEGNLVEHRPDGSTAPIE
jgi:hypothetical protein